MSEEDKIRLVSWGAVGCIFRVAKQIALKRSLTLGDERIKNEHSIFDLLETKPRCPFIVCSFLRFPDYNCLEYMPGGTLEQRLRTWQLRDASDRITKVITIAPSATISLWTAELTAAAAWLEGFGVAHGDIRPPNILLDSTDHLKLADFDCTRMIGHELEAGAPPYARVQGPEAGDQCGTFGRMGARSEQFAIGSVLYYLTRGYEPYDMVEFKNDRGPEIVDLLQKMQYPDTEEGDDIDALIKKCWEGQFTSVNQLAANARLIQIDEIRGSVRPDVEELKQLCLQKFSLWEQHVNNLLTSTLIAK